MAQLKRVPGIMGLPLHSAVNFFSASAIFPRLGAQNRAGKAVDSSENEELRRELEELRMAHRDLDDAIDALMDTGRADMIRIQRLKKQKLALKDRITKVENALLPDIIA